VHDSVLSPDCWRNQSRCLMLFAWIAWFWLASPEAFSQGEVQLDQHEDVQHAISAFSKCLKSLQPNCIAASISTTGVTLAVDGPLISRNSLVQKLHSDRATQCLFWGTHCTASKTCSISSALADTDPGDIGQPRLYEKHWQVDVQSRPRGTCSDGMPFVFQLEHGHWKLVAIPYT